MENKKKELKSVLISFKLINHNIFINPKKEKSFQ